MVAVGGHLVPSELAIAAYDKAHEPKKLVIPPGGHFDAWGSPTSVTAGTIFDRTRTPLTVWFTACWSFATAKDGIFGSQPAESA